MAIHDLTAAYQTKTDEELLQLAGNPEQLTPEVLSCHLFTDPGCVIVCRHLIVIAKGA